MTSDKKKGTCGVAFETILNGLGVSYELLTKGNSRLMLIKVVRKSIPHCLNCYKRSCERQCIPLKRELYKKILRGESSLA